MTEATYRGVHLDQDVSEYLRVWLLGTGSPSLQVCRHGISTLMLLKGRYFLFDTGRATLQRMYECGIPAQKVENVFITHLHSDHICGMPDFWMTAWFTMHRSNPLQIYGPEGTERFVEGMKEMHHFDLEVRPTYETAPIEGIHIVPHEFDEGVVYDQDGVKITAFMVDHGPSMPAYGFRIDCDGKVIVLSGDTTYNKNVVRNATDCDLLIHAVAAASERQLRDNEITRRLVLNHTSPEQLAMVIEEAKPRMTLLHHISTWRVTEYDITARIRAGTHVPVEMGQDRMEILVGDDIKIFPSNAPATGEDLIVSDTHD